MTQRDFDTTMPSPKQWAAALRVVEVSRDVRDIMFGSKQAFPKKELIEAVDAFDQEIEVDN